MCCYSYFSSTGLDAVVEMIQEAAVHTIRHHKTTQQASKLPSVCPAPSNFYTVSNIESLDKFCKLWHLLILMNTCY